MKINTHLLNLFSQILEAEQAYANPPEGTGKDRNFYSREVVRLKDAAVAEMISSAPFATTYTAQTAQIKLGQTLELFKVYEKEPKEADEQPRTGMSDPEYAAVYAKATRTDNFDGGSTQFPHLFCGNRHTGPEDVRGFVISPEEKH
jgi:hypothetical protein